MSELVLPPDVQDEIEEAAEQETPTVPELTEEQAAQVQMAQIMQRLDPTYPQRQQALARVDRTLGRAFSGAKIDRKDIVQALSGLRDIMGTFDELYRGQLLDLLRISQGLQQHEQGLFAANARTQTIGEALKKFTDCDDEALQEVHAEVVEALVEAHGGNPEDTEVDDLDLDDEEKVEGSDEG